MNLPSSLAKAKGTSKPRRFAEHLNTADSLQSLLITALAADFEYCYLVIIRLSQAKIQV
jgi:hypothetical protein